jgi:3-hydroxybutyryl-CoA dehydratase
VALSDFKTNSPEGRVVHMEFKDLSVGLVRELHWTVAPSDVDAFAACSGDFNPLHVDAAFARQAGFPDRVAHGFLLGAKISAFVGMVMPGRDCLLLETQLAWPAAIFSGDAIRIRGEIVELSEDNQVMRIKFRAVATRAGRELVVGRGWTLCQIRS